MKFIGKMPQNGFGTWDLRDKEGQEAIEFALQTGYRHLDTADWYHNHDIVGQAIKSSGIDRQEIFLVTKVYPPLNPDKIKRDAKRFLGELQVNYIDLLLIHWPDSTAQSEIMPALQELIDDGTTKYVGVSSYSKTLIEEALATGIQLETNQIEVSPGKFPQRLIEDTKSLGLSVTAYSPLEMGRRISSKTIHQLAEQYSTSPQQITLAWLMAKDLVVIPRSSNKEHIKSNFEAENLRLTDQEVKKITTEVSR